MSKEEIKKLIKKRYRDEFIGVLIFFAIALVICSAIGSVYGFAFVIAIFFVYFKTAGIDDIKAYLHPEDDICFVMYGGDDSLGIMLDELINKPIFKKGVLTISEHFILFADQFQNIIKVSDIFAFRKQPVENNPRQYKIQFVTYYNEPHSFTFLDSDANKLYDLLKEKCPDAKDDYTDEYIKDEKLFKERVYFCKETLYTDDKKIAKRKKKEKEVTKEIVEDKPVKEVEKEPVKEVKPDVKEVKEETSVKSFDDKYNDLTKLKELLDNGILTQKEYDEEKAKILSR